MDAARRARRGRNALLIVVAMPAFVSILVAAGEQKKPPPAPPAGVAAAREAPRQASGSRTGRNPVSPATGLPERWSPETGENIRWVAQLGSETYGGPVVAGGKVFVGTNNATPRDPSIEGDRGVLMAFSAADGKFLWQAVHDKLAVGGESDWPLQGVCSTPFVDGDRIYYVSNRGELVAADVEGFADGENDGPFTGETRHGPADADLVWVVDMPKSLGVHPHRMSASSPLVVGDVVYALTSHGVDEKGKVPSPTAPSFIAVDKRTGAILWKDSSPGDRILDGQWSNPSYGVVGGIRQVLFPGGDGWLYAFDPATGAPLWKFDAGGSGPARESLVASAVVEGDRIVIGVGQDPEKGAAKGKLWALRGDGHGDVTATAAAWSLGGEDFGRTLSSTAIDGGLVYAADLRGFLSCLDASTGKVVWSHDTFAAVWGSPLVADGKVYLGDEDGDVAVLRAGRTKQVLSEINMGNAVYTTPAAQDGVLYVATRAKLFAIGKK
jgi:putative pyrroloquinoline-quinone binding quinoprotein